MKILIIGNRAHQFITNYVSNLRLGTNTITSIDVLSYECGACEYSTDGVYDRIFSLSFPYASLIPKTIRILVQHFLLRYRLKSIQGQYDIIHIHYAENFLLRDAKYLTSTIKTKLVITLWGSDLLRANAKQANRLKRWIDKADKVTMATDEMINSFCEKYGANKYTNSKIKQCKFGLQPLNWIEKKWNDDLRNLRDEIGIPKDRIVVTIGHNASRLQHHEMIIDTLEKDSSLLKMKDSLLFVLMMTYPQDNEYKDLIREKTCHSNYQYIIVDSFLSEEEVANYRLTSDFFIQLQPTDVLSGSMLEYLACNGIIITGSWLPYQLLKELKIRYYTIDKIEDVSTTLLQLLYNYEEIKNSLKDNHSIIMNNFKWEHLIENWINVYNEVVSA